MNRGVLVNSGSPTIRRLFARSARPGLGHLDDGVGQSRRLDLGRPPAEFDLGRHALALQPPPRELDQLGGDPLAFQVLRTDGPANRSARTAPTGPAAADLAVDQLGQLDDLGVVLLDPVVPGQPAVERAVLDVPRHFLGPDQRAVDLLVVDGRVIAPAGERDLVAGLAEQVGGRLLQAAGGKTEFEDVGHAIKTVWQDTGGQDWERPGSRSHVRILSILFILSNLLIDAASGQTPARRRPAARRRRACGRSRTRSPRGRPPRRPA